jgi:hypothetical protein
MYLYFLYINVLYIMSVNIPILDEGVPVNRLGSEFNKYQQDQRDRGLIDPTLRDPEYSSTNTSVAVRPDGELWNQQIIFENNHNPKGLIRYTDAQSLQKLLDNSAYERSKTETEKQLELTEDFDLDPELRGKLLQESLADGSDIFHIKSKDYVDEVQESLRQYNKEKNLYLQKALGGQRGLAGKTDLGDIMKGAGIKGSQARDNASKVLLEYIKLKRDRGEVLDTSTVDDMLSAMAP